jgi:hypothetical protein
MDGTESFAVNSIFCGKKIYMDKLMNENGMMSFLTRMKGIRTDAIRITTNKIYPKLNQVELKNN